MSEDKIIKKLEEHDKRFAAHDKQFDVIVKKLMEHDDRFDRTERKMEGLMTKEDGQEIKEVLEVLVTTVNKIADDHVYTNDNVKRLTDKVESHDVDIKKIKVQLKMA